MHILVIDNYDSFTYNLVHYLEDLDCLVTVKRNDQLTIEEVADYDKIVLSPERQAESLLRERKRMSLQTTQW